MAKNTKPAPSKIILTDAFNKGDDVVDTTALLLAAIDSDKGSLREIYNLLSLAGADPNKPDPSGRTPMDAALARHWYAAADLLMDFGATPPAYDGDPDGPLVYKARNGTWYVNEEQEMKSETPLTYYIKKSDFSTVYPIIANGADINKKNDRHDTPLKVAVERGWPSMTRQIIRYGGWIDPDKKDPNEVVDKKTGATRLLLMIQEGTDGEAVKRILDVEGADPNKPDRYGLTPLALARAMKWPFVEKMLLDRGADPNVKFPDPNQKCGKDNDTPLLIYASLYQNCHANYFLALLEAGADPDATDEEGKTTAYWAAQYGHTWHFDWMQEKGADIFKKDENGAGPLHVAALNAHTDIVESILDVIPPGEINAAMTDGRTALYIACTERKEAEGLCELLIENGADAKAVTDYGSTLLHQAAYSFSPAFIKKLIALGADVNAATKDGTTPINKAISGEKPENLRLLLEAGASIDKANQGKHDRPLFQTVSRGRKGAAEMARLLLEHGADPHQRGESEQHESERGSIFYYAMSNRAYDVAAELLKAGADPHDTGFKGESAMHECLHWGDVKSIELLLEAGFDPLKVFSFPDRWGDGDDRDKLRMSSAYDEALRLVEKYGDEREYKQKLKLIEESLLQPAAPEQAPAPAAVTTPKAGKTPSI